MMEHDCYQHTKQVSERWIENTYFGVMCRKEYRCSICGKKYVQYSFPRYSDD